MMHGHSIDEKECHQSQNKKCERVSVKAKQKDLGYHITAARYSLTNKEEKRKCIFSRKLKTYLNVLAENLGIGPLKLLKDKSLKHKNSKK